MSNALAIVTEMIDEPWHPNWQPQPHMLVWFQRFLSMQREGSMWGSSHGHVYKISPANKTLTLVAGNPNDPVSWHKKNIVTLGKLGWKVLPDVLGQDGQASFAESEEDDLKDEIGRMTTPIANERGVMTFKHRGSTLDVDGSISGYFLPVVQPIYYGSNEEANDSTGEVLYRDALLNLRSAGHTTVKAVLDAYVKWGTMKVYQNEDDITGHPKSILAHLDVVRDWPSTSGKVATLRL